MKKLPYATVDTSHHPLVTVRFTGAAGTDDSFSQYLDEVLQAYEAGGRMGILFDATDATMPSYAHIRMQADWLEKHEALMASQCAGTAYVLPNVLVRTALKMIFALQKQPVPYAIFAEEQPAKEWLYSRKLSTSQQA